MAATRTVTHTAVALGGVSWRQLVAGESLFLLLPELAEGTLVSADLAYRARLGHLAAELRLDAGPRAGRIQQRLAFWLAREGGWSRAVAAMSPGEAAHFRESLARCDVSHRDVGPGGWAGAVRAVFAAAGAPAPPAAPAGPELRLRLGAAGAQGLAFTPAGRLLDVPSPVAPPAGDVLRVLVETGAAPGERYAARATVVAVRRPADAAAEAPPGFTLAIDEGAQDAEAVLAARCPRPGPDPAAGAGEPAASGELEAAVPDAAARPRRVLVVDDDALVRTLYSDALAARGFETLAAADGETGLRTIVDELLALDAVVTDVHMPGLAGDALVAAVRQAGGEAELVLVAVTADAAPELAERLRRAGADAVVSKGAGPDAAVAAVELALERHADPRVIHAPAPVAATRFSGEPGDIAVTH